jgi:hypothetical protein
LLTTEAAIADTPEPTVSCAATDFTWAILVFQDRTGFRAIFASILLRDRSATKSDDQSP